MVKKKTISTDEQSLRKDMYKAAKGMNKYITDEYMDNLSTQSIVGLTSPLYRAEWQRKLNNINGIEHQED